MAENVPSYFTKYFNESLHDQLIKDASAGSKKLPHSFCFQQKKREVIDVHSGMKMRRQELASTLRDLKGHKDANRETANMRDNIQNFDDFTKEKEEKRCKAMKKAERERKLTEQKQAEICALQEEMKAMIEEEERLKKEVQKKAVYQTYLEKVAQGSKQFQDPEQVISRFDTLMLTQEELVHTAQRNQDSIENARAELARYLQQSNDILLHHNNTLAQLQSQLDKAHADRILWESRWAHIQNTAAKKTLLLGTIKMATLNVYQSLYRKCKDTEVAPLAPEDTLKQLEKIPNYFSILMSIWEDLTKQDK